MKVDLSGLNPQQLAAVRTTSGALLLLAGAGTGKTRVITYRIAYLVAQGVKPENILAVTFTNKAAREMQERLASLLSVDEAKQITASTFHSFCAGVLRQKIRLLGYSPNFDIAPQGYQVGLVRTIMSELGYGRGGLRAEVALALISRAKSSLCKPEQMAQESGDWPPGMPEIYRLYQQRMKNMDMVDFDDLLFLVVELWRQHPEVLAAHQQRYQYLLIDEYQDTNGVQFQLMASLAGAQANICAVGDDDQSIYGWRGADITNILRFEEHFPNTRVIRLEQNYRSTNTILTAANHIIANNSERHAKRLWSDRGDGERILVVNTETDITEGQFLVDLVRDRRATRNCQYNDFAVLYRSNHQSRILENALRQATIPYRLVGSKSFYERREILDAVSFLRAVQNPRDDQSTLRILNVPPRGIGDRSVQRLREMKLVTALPIQELLQNSEFLEQVPSETAAGVRRLISAFQTCRKRLKEGEGLARIVTELLNEVGYLNGLGAMYKPREDALRRRDNVLEFITAIAEYEGRQVKPARLRDFLELFTLQDDSDKVDKHGQGEQAVTLMTVHSAKGLEFPVVVVVGLENGLFPHHQSVKERSVEEERRLFYVAVTRAQEELILIHACQRRVQNDVISRRLSPFVLEIPEELMESSDATHALQPATAEAAADFLAQMKAMFAPPQ